MATFAVLDHNNDVFNFIVAESKEVAEEVTGKTCIPRETTDCIGYKWNGSEFVAPPAVEEQPAVE